MVQYFGFSAGIREDHPLSLEWQQRLSKTPRRSYGFVTQLVGKANTDSRKQMIDELAEQTSAQNNFSNLSPVSSGVSNALSMTSVEMLDLEPSTSKKMATDASQADVAERQIKGCEQTVAAAEKIDQTTNKGVTQVMTNHVDMEKLVWRFRLDHHSKENNKARRGFPPVPWLFIGLARVSQGWLVRDS